jgi:hypothetical protein
MRRLNGLSVGPDGVRLEQPIEHPSFCADGAPVEPGEVVELDHDVAESLIALGRASRVE